MYDPTHIEKLLRTRECILTFIELDEKAMLRTPDDLGLKMSLANWRRQLVSIDTSASALTGLPPDHYQARD